VGYKEKVTGINSQIARKRRILEIANKSTFEKVQVRPFPGYTESIGSGDFTPINPANRFFMALVPSEVLRDESCKR
jgi:hypothetical protein